MTDDRMEGETPEPVIWTEREREALSALPREKDPGRLFEERTVRALRDEGLLTAPLVPRGTRREERPGESSRPWWRSAVAIAAGVALFAGGLSFGQWLGARQTADAFQTAFEGTQDRLAVQVQRTGTDYVAALSALADAQGTSAADSGQAFEVALTALWAAANEIVRLAPDDPLAARILQGLEARTQLVHGAASGGQQLLVEF